MAEYISANRWITGVATHKTKCGRILCTGFGCIGCFPQDFPEIARELQVYDSATGLPFGEETLTSQLDNKSIMETEEQQVKLRCHLEIKKSQKNELKMEHNTSNLHSKNTGNNIQTGAEFKKFFLTEYEETEGNKQEIFTDTDELRIGKENRTLEETTLTLNTVCREKLRNDKILHVQPDDCVCLFFDLELNHNARQISNFGILEIVNSLTTIMRVNDIKCVQRFNGLWHIVLRSTKHLRYLLTNGITIREKCYQVVLATDDIYCEKV